MSRTPPHGRSPRLSRSGRAGRRAPDGNGPAYVAPGMKRSTKVTLAMAGVAAVGVYLATREPRCRPVDPNNPLEQQQQPCRSSSSSSSSGRTWHSSSGSGSSSRSTQGLVSRSGFGAIGRAISAGHGGS